MHENLNEWLKFIIGLCFCIILIMMSSLSMYSVVFVTQPMSGMAPADKQFFLLLSDMSKYILGALATLIAVKGKDALPQFVPPPSSIEKQAAEPPPKPMMTTTTTVVRQEPSLEPVAPVVSLGFGGKPAPPAAPQPEI
ncbi:hypothetical protein UFOVP177_63 [uncultured Caudovirales phage]|uniref:Uncharacterized protein n=1 Tax=uncultured Caudovirales phage TaxID=2100421 RepID=A0A6J7WCK5_9CAUD|nr:hypothetical protein UFOVP177_63 [uncultured Caudovirales phage]